MTGLPRILVTPDAEGRLRPPAAGAATVPASAYLEAPLGAAEQAVDWLPDVWRDDRRSQELAHRAAALSFRLSDALEEEIGGRADPTLRPLTLDIANFFVEVALERMLRLGDAGWQGGASLAPESIAYSIDRIDAGIDFKQAQKRQSFQWLVLRLLADADDRIEWRTGPPLQRLRRRFSEIRHGLAERRTPPSAGLYGAHLRGYAALFAELGFPVASVPNLVQKTALHRDERTRARIAERIAAELRPVLRDFGLPDAGLPRLARFFAAALPTSRVELRAANRRRYERWFDRHEVKAFATETGQAKYDPNMFFAAECNCRGLPTVVIQHGGQYGYDARIAGFFTIDVGLPTHFVSWGWSEYPGGYDRSLQRATIVPLPNPTMSRLTSAPRLRAPGPRTLLVPLSKFRTLDNRIGGNATDGNVRQLRAFVAAVVDRVEDRFERIILTHRARDFDTDILSDWLRRRGRGGVEVLPSREAPVRKLLDSTDAVLWDVTATGLFETLTADVPTVALFRRGRWAAEATWAERLLAEHGVAAYDAEGASASLGAFLDEPGRWQRAREALQPVLDRYARGTEDYRERWRDFLNRLSTRPEPKEAE
jgi:hypothetical protein